MKFADPSFFVRLSFLANDNKMRTICAVRKPAAHLNQNQTKS